MAVVMRHEDLVLRTKLIPPRLSRRALPRPALVARLREALEYRLTLVQAGTGYGKTTALARLDTEGLPLFWYTVEEADADPQQFLLYLISAFHTQLLAMSDLPFALLQEGEGTGSTGVWIPTLDALINVLEETLTTPALLVLDDYHCVARSPDITALVERFISYLPDNLHLVIATRHPPESPGIARWRLRGEVLEIGDAELAFRPAEIEALFHQTYGLRLSSQEIAVLAEKTEGWPIVLQLVWQDLRNNPGRSVADVFARGYASLGALFDYLAREVVARQPPEVARFLYETAVLRRLTPAACDAVTSDTQGAALLSRLLELDLFVVALGEQHYRYHHLFHDFLCQQIAANRKDTRERHRRAARFFEAQQNDEEAIYHWLAAGDTYEAAAAIERAGEGALRLGRLDTVAAWIDALPAEMLSDLPLLQVYRGDVCRLRSAFDQALHWYAQAEQTWRSRGDRVGVCRALRGQASVYLDTVRPVQAEHVLEEALRLIDSIDDRENRARLLELAAENRLNLGDPAGAERLHIEARALRETGPGGDIVSARVKFRTGQLAESRRILEEWVVAEREGARHGLSRPPLAHREALLLLSITYAFLGHAEEAIATAQEGIALGERLHSPFITAVAYTRLGHALQLRPNQTWPPERSRAQEEAVRCFHTAIALSEGLAVRRARVEALWGLTRAYGFFGDLDSARKVAAEGVEMARLDGDAWFATSVELMLGASYVLAGQPDTALPVLSHVLTCFREYGDTFGQTATRLWLCLAYLDLRQMEHVATAAAALLERCEAHAYDCLFTAPSMLAPPDSRRLIPLLIAARDRGIRPGYVARLLAAVGLPEVTAHPGYQLRVQTLGAFRVWRGENEIDPRAWKRDKARQLFQLLLTYRGRWLQREMIVERLWPDLAFEVTSRDFKIALNVLNKALEPLRAEDAPYSFIARNGKLYRIPPEADLWLDAAVFEQMCEDGLRLLAQGTTEEAIARLRAALGLYGGEYLPDALYEDWVAKERERLLALYLRAADRLAETLIAHGRYDEAIGICDQMIAQDPCWERAYVLMMQAYAGQGNRALAVRVYLRCSETLYEELGVEPSPETTALYHHLT